MAASLRLYRLWQARCFRSNNKSFFPQIEQPNEGHGRLIFEVFGLHTMTHYSRFDSSGRGIGQSLRPVPDNTQHSQQTDIHACGGGGCFLVYSLALCLYLNPTWFFVFTVLHFAICLYLQHTTQTSMPPGEVRTRKLSKRATTDRSATGLGRIRTFSIKKRATADPRLRPLCHWDKLTVNC